MKKIFLVVNEDRFFLSHRKDVAVAAKSKGYDVTVVAKDTGRVDEIRALGVKWIDLPINPTGMNLSDELNTLRFLYKLYRKERPDLVHHIGLKLILWGGLAAKLAKVKGVVNAVSGLGVLFSGDKPSFMARMVLQVIRFSSNRRNISLIFQNHEDMGLFVDHHIIKPKYCDFIKGSGVDLSEYHYTSEPEEGPVKVIFTARMVKEKGTFELIDAAERLRSEFEGKVQFLLCGGLSNNPKGIKKEELEALCDGKYIQWLGYRSDVKQILMNSHIMAFPSYYREGVPRSLIEATAIGRPIVTTHSYGCKDTVDDGVNGFLVPIQNSKQLAEKLRVLISDKALRERMGKAGREKAEREFSIVGVVKKHMEIYQRLIGE